MHLTSYCKNTQGKTTWRRSRNAGAYWSCKDAVTWTSDHRKYSKHPRKDLIEALSPGIAPQIGRASCRERVKTSEVAVSLKKKQHRGALHRNSPTDRKRVG